MWPVFLFSINLMSLFMKRLSTLIACTLVYSGLSAQTISLTDASCLGGPDVATLAASDGGSPARNIYQGTANNGAFPFQVIWNNGASRWEIQFDTDFSGDYETVVHSNPFASVPNPPALGTGTWTDETGGACGNLTGFSGTGTQTGLPVDLLAFRARPGKDQVLLSWVTASELNNDRFEVEHSLDAETFVQVGTVRGVGTTQDVQTYQFAHPVDQSGTHYYRLRQVDTDGTFTYSPVVSVQVSVASQGLQARLYPNPNLSGRFFLRLPKDPVQPDLSAQASPEVYVQVSDLSGRVLVRKKGTVQHAGDLFSFDLSGLPKGVFVARLSYAGGADFQKIHIE